MKTKIDSLAASAASREQVRDGRVGLDRAVGDPFVDARIAIVARGRIGWRQRRDALLESGSARLCGGRLRPQLGFVQSIVVAGAVQPVLDDEVADRVIAPGRRRENNRRRTLEHLRVLLIESGVGSGVRLERRVVDLREARGHRAEDAGVLSDIAVSYTQ